MVTLRFTRLFSLLLLMFLSSLVPIVGASLLAMIVIVLFCAVPACIPSCGITS